MFDPSFFEYFFCKIFKIQTFSVKMELLHFQPTFYKLARRGHLKTAYISFVGSKRVLLVLTLALRASELIILTIFANIISIIIRNALFIFDILEIFFKKTDVFSTFRSIRSFLRRAAISGLILISPWILTVKQIILPWPFWKKISTFVVLYVSY